jgi:hypothetical protein
MDAEDHFRLRNTLNHHQDTVLSFAIIYKYNNNKLLFTRYNLLLFTLYNLLLFIHYNLLLFTRYNLLIYNKI